MYACEATAAMKVSVSSKRVPHPFIIVIIIVIILKFDEKNI